MNEKRIDNMKLSDQMIQALQYIGKYTPSTRFKTVHGTTLKALKARGLVTTHSRIRLTAKGKAILSSNQVTPTPSFDNAFHELFNS